MFSLDFLRGETLEWLLMGAVFLLVASACFSILWRAMSWQSACGKVRLPDSEGDTKADLVLGELTPALAAQVPLGSEAGAELHRELRAAGYYRPSAVMEYAAVRTLLVVTPIVAAGMLALVAEPDQLGAILIGGGIAGLLGYSLPRVVVHLQGRERVRRLEAGLPMAVDLLTLCLTAGQNVLAAFHRVSRELHTSHPQLACELEIVREQAELRSLSFALRQWAERVPSAEVRNLAMILMQAEKLGTDSAAALQEWSTNLRTDARQKADARANRTMFWMLFPTILCLWIPAGIMIIAPAVLEFQEQRRETFQQWRQSREELRNLNPTAPAEAFDPPPVITIRE